MRGGITGNWEGGVETRDSIVRVIIGMGGGEDTAMNFREFLIGFRVDLIVDNVCLIRFQLENLSCHFTGGPPLSTTQTYESRSPNSWLAQGPEAGEAQFRAGSPKSNASIRAGDDELDSGMRVLKERRNKLSSPSLSTLIEGRERSCREADFTPEICYGDFKYHDLQER